MSNIKELYVIIMKCGEAVTMECNISDVKKKNSLSWYRQFLGKVPQFLVRPYSNTQGYTFVDGFTDSRFSVTVKDQKFDLNINGIREDDGGEYFCGYVEGSTVKFTSGTRLQFEGSGGFSLTALNIISVIVIIVLAGFLIKNQIKGASSSNHQTPTNQ
ncbi:putative immune-type receptor 7 precursor, partial [Clarias magur]